MAAVSLSKTPPKCGLPSAVIAQYSTVAASSRWGDEFPVEPLPLTKFSCARTRTRLEIARDSARSLGCANERLRKSSARHDISIQGSRFTLGPIPSSAGQRFLERLFAAGLLELAHLRSCFLGLGFRDAGAAEEHERCFLALRRPAPATAGPQGETFRGLRVRGRFPRTSSSRGQSQFPGGALCQKPAASRARP
jgi:hypothetical protein